LALSKKRVGKVAAGGFHTLALCDDGSLFSWGNGIHGECGIGESIEVYIPRQIKIPKINDQEEGEVSIV
jgi:alpha-tubulin suppressor-like RCC1 family protein